MNRSSNSFPKFPWPTLPPASLWSNVLAAAVIMFSSPSKWTPTLKGMEQEQIVLWSWAVAVVENHAPQIFSFPVAAPVVVGVAGAYLEKMLNIQKNCHSHSTNIMHERYLKVISKTNTICSKCCFSCTLNSNSDLEQENLQDVQKRCKNYFNF